jgi:rubredoxin
MGMKTTKPNLIKINLPGGVTSAGDLYEILVIAKRAGASHIRFGNRQQLYFSIQDDALEDFEFDMLSADVDYELNTDNFPNIISSYVADTVFNNDNWVKEGVYKDIFDLFNFRPQLKINIVDSNQTFVPFYTGNLNFISSHVSNYWYLYIRFPKTNLLYCWASLVYSDDIPGIAKKIEEVIFKNKNRFYEQPEIDGDAFYKLVMEQGNFVVQQATQALAIPEFHLPYYEGFNRYGNKYWLGIYRRDELFSVDFLMECCMLCNQTRVGQLYITPWKSILIKGIEVANRALWGIILNKYRINVRHAANEMNWQIEDVCDFCLDLKKDLVRYFEEADLRTYRLSFAIKKQPKTGLFGSVIIRKQEDLFEISHTRDFNPNSKDFISYKQNVEKDELPPHLMQLCDLFYTRETQQFNTIETDAFEQDESSAPITVSVYQCKSCLSVYDKTFGDEVNDIAPGVDFDDVIDYTCPVCDAPKNNFEPVNQPLFLNS